MKNKVTSLILAVMVVFSSIITVVAQSTTARVYSVYADNMLFKQNEPAVISGEAAPSNTISAELILNGSIISKGETKTDSSGRFNVSFLAPEGSFSKYKVIL